MPPTADNRVGDRARGADVIEDRGAGLLDEQVLREDRGHEVAVDELAGVVDEEAAIRVPVPGDAEVGARLQDLVDDELAVLRQQRVGLVIGEVPVRRPVGLDEVQAQPRQQRAGHRAGHPVAAVDDDLQRVDVGVVDEGQRRGLELRLQVDRLDTAGGRGDVSQTRLDQAPDVLDALVAAQRDRALLDELRAGVGLRVVRGGAHQPAIELARADQEVEDLGADLPGIDHRRALGDDAIAVAPRELGCRQAHVAPEADGHVAGVFAREPGDDAGESATDLLGDITVDLVTVDPPDVIGLEDAWRDDAGWGGHCDAMLAWRPRNADGDDDTGDEAMNGVANATTESDSGARRPQNFLAGDGLRGFACMAILLFHLSVGAALRYGDTSAHLSDSYGDIPGGLLVCLRASVTVFFALSGYLIGGPFVRAWIERRPLPALGKYAGRRIRRILPAYWVVLLFLLIRNGALDASAGQIVAMFGFLHTWVGFDAGPGGVSFLDRVPQMWTVDIDIFFYVAAPVLALVLTELARRRVLPMASESARRAFVIAGLIVTGVASVWVAGRAIPGYTEGRVGKSLIAWWAAFVPGILLAAVEVPGRLRLRGTQLGRVLSFSALGLAAIALLIFGRIAPTRYHLSPIVEIAGGTLTVVAAMLWQWTDRDVWKIFDIRPVRALGRWSFGIYLWHVAVIYECFQIMEPRDHRPAVQVAILIIPVCAASITLGALSWHFIEHPLTRRSKKPVPAESAVLG